MRLVSANTVFEPAELRIKAGDAVRWSNREKRTSHSGRFPLAEGGLESERMFPGESRQRDIPINADGTNTSAARIRKMKGGCPLSRTSLDRPAFLAFTAGEPQVRSRKRAVAHTGTTKELVHLVRQDCRHGMTLQGGLGPAALPSTSGQAAEGLAATIFTVFRPGTPMPPWKRFMTEPRRPDC